MDGQTHKAHRPSQSGAKAEKKKGKGKEKQKGNNVKVSGFVTHPTNPDISPQRHSHQNRAVELSSKDAARQSWTKQGFMSLWWIVHPKMSLRPSSWPSSALQVLAKQPY